MDQAENLRQLVKNSIVQGGPVILTVASGKGGTGKTSFSINFSIALAQKGKSVMVIDADFGLANVDLMLGGNPRYHIGDVLDGRVTLREAICQGHGGIWYVAGGSGVMELLNLKASRLDALQRQLQELDTKLDFIIFDCGAGVNSQVMRLMAATDECLLLVTPEPTAIVDAFVLVKSLSALQPPPPIRFVMNRAETPLEAMTMARSFKSIVQKYLNREMEFLGHISFDKSVVHSIKKQMPYVICYPNCQAAKDIERIAAQYAGGEPRRGSGLRSLLERMAMRRDR